MIKTKTISKMFQVFMVHIIHKPCAIKTLISFEVAWNKVEPTLDSHSNPKQMAMDFGDIQ